MTSTLHLTGRVAVVTGAGRGIGRAYALALTAAGAAVVVNDLDPEAADDVVADIRAGGGTAAPDYSDIAAEGSGEALVKAAERFLGPVDVIIANAGVATMPDGGDVYSDRSTVRSMIDLHLLGTLEPVCTALPGMIERGWGRIITTVSEVAMSPRSGAGNIAYGVAKGAVWSASLALAAQTAGSGVTVNAISPGARTRMSADEIDSNPGSRELDLDPGHVARAVLRLLSEEFADVSGAVVHVAGRHVREYLPMRRTEESGLVSRLSRDLGSPIR